MITPFCTLPALWHCRLLFLLLGTCPCYITNKALLPHYELVSLHGCFPSSRLCFHILKKLSSTVSELTFKD